MWPKTYPAFLAPDATAFSITPWEEGCQEALAAMREVALQSDFWSSLSDHFSAENHSDVCVQDNISCVKSICEFTNHALNRVLTGPLVQVLLYEPFEVLRPIVEKLLDDKDKNKQRGAAEFIAGLLGGKYPPSTLGLNNIQCFAGSKHWPTDQQIKLWEWLKPYLPTILGQRNNETVSIWTSFLEVCGSLPLQSVL